jgi:hypothetical protein
MPSLRSDLFLSLRWLKSKKGSPFPAFGRGELLRASLAVWQGVKVRFKNQCNNFAQERLYDVSTA